MLFLSSINNQQQEEAREFVRMDYRLNFLKLRIITERVT